MNRTTLILVLALTLPSCGGGTTGDMDPAVRQAACTAEAAAGTAFMAGSDVASAASHQLVSSGTPYTITLPTAHDGFVGFHVAQLHTTIDVIVKQPSDIGPVTMAAGLPSDVLFDQGAIGAGVAPAPSCSDLYVYRLHVDVPGDFELQLPSNAANRTWVMFQITQVGHDI